MEHNRLKILPKYFIRGHSSVKKIKKIELPDDTYIIFFVTSGRVCSTVHETYSNMFQKFTSKVELNKLVSDMLVRKTKYSDFGFDIKYPGDLINEQTIKFTKSKNNEKAILGKVKLPNSSIANSYLKCGKLTTDDKLELSKLIETPGIYFIGTCRSLSHNQPYNVITNFAINAKRRKINKESMNLIYDNEKRVLEINHSRFTNNRIDKILLTRYELGKNKYLSKERLQDLKIKIDHMFKYSKIISSQQHYAKKNPKVNTNKLVELYIKMSLKDVKENKYFNEIHRRVLFKFSVSTITFYINMYIDKYGIDLTSTYNTIRGILNTNMELLGYPSITNKNKINKIKNAVKIIDRKNILSEENVEQLKEFNKIFNNIYQRINNPKQIKSSKLLNRT